MEYRDSKLLDYVLKTCENSLKLVRDEEDPLLQSIRLFVDSNLGIKLDEVCLEYISSRFMYRIAMIEERGLTPLKNKLYGLDRNILENRNSVMEFIQQNYRIPLNGIDLGPRRSNDDILDDML
jgi:hypothetical protein